MCKKNGWEEVEEEGLWGGGWFWIVAAAGWLLGWFPWQRVCKKSIGSVPQSRTDAMYKRITFYNYMPSTLSHSLYVFMSF